MSRKVPFQSMPFVSHAGVMPSNEATNEPQQPTNLTNKATRLGYIAGEGPAPPPAYFEGDQSKKATQEGIPPWHGSFLL